MAKSAKEADTTEVELIEASGDTPEPAAWRRRLAGVARIMDPSSSVPVYFGVLVAMAGFALIAVTWGEVAALTSVALQLPYLVSGGLTGLALVMVGMTIVNVQVRRRDVAERARQMERLAGILGEAGGRPSRNGARRMRAKRVVHRARR